MRGGDSCFINYLCLSITGKCVQSMFKVLKKKKIPYEKIKISEAERSGSGGTAADKAEKIR